AAPCHHVGARGQRRRRPGALQRGLRRGLRRHGPRGRRGQLHRGPADARLPAHRVRGVGVLMTQQTLLVLLLGAVVGAGVLLVIVGMSDRGEDKPLKAPSRSLRDRIQGRSRRALFAVGAGLVILLLTSWPVLAVAVGLLVWFAP